MMKPTDTEQIDPALAAFEKITYEDLIQLIGPDSSDNETQKPSTLPILDPTITDIFSKIRYNLAHAKTMLQNIADLNKNNAELEKKITTTPNDTKHAAERAGNLAFLEANKKRIHEYELVIESDKTANLFYNKLLKDILGYCFLEGYELKITEPKSIVNFFESIKEMEISKISPKVFDKIQLQNSTSKINKSDKISEALIKIKKPSATLDIEFIELIKKEALSQRAYESKKNEFLTSEASFLLQSMDALRKIKQSKTSTQFDSETKSNLINLYEVAIKNSKLVIISLKDGDYPNNLDKFFPKLTQHCQHLSKITSLADTLQFTGSTVQYDLDNPTEDKATSNLYALINKNQQRKLKYHALIKDLIDDLQKTNHPDKEKITSNDCAYIKQLFTERSDAEKTEIKKTAIRKTDINGTQKSFKDFILFMLSTNENFDYNKNIQKSCFSFMKAILSKQNGRSIVIKKFLEHPSGETINALLQSKEIDFEIKKTINELLVFARKDSLNENEPLMKKLSAHGLSCTAIFTYEHALSPSEFALGYSTYCADPQKTSKENLKNSIKTIMEIYNIFPEKTPEEKNTKKYLLDALVELVLSDKSLEIITDETIPFPENIKLMIGKLQETHTSRSQNNHSAEPIRATYLSDFTDQDQQKMINAFNSMWTRSARFFIGGSDINESPLLKLYEKMQDNISSDFMRCNNIEETIEKYKKYIMLAEKFKSNKMVFCSIWNSISSSHVISQGTSIKSRLSDQEIISFNALENLFKETPSPFGVFVKRETENIDTYESIINIGAEKYKNQPKTLSSENSEIEQVFLSAIEKNKPNPQKLHLQYDSTKDEIILYCQSNLARINFIEDLSIVIKNQNNQYEKLFGQDAFNFIRQKTSQNEALSNIRSKFEPNKELQVTIEKNKATITLMGAKSHSIFLSRVNDSIFVTHEYLENATQKKQRDSTKQSPNSSYNSLYNIIIKNTDSSTDSEDFILKENGLKSLLEDIEKYCINKKIPVKTIDFEEIERALAPAPSVIAKRPQTIPDFIEGLINMYHNSTVDTNFIKKYIKMDILDKNLTDSIDAVYSYLYIAQTISKSEPVLCTLLIDAIESTIESEPLLEWQDYRKVLTKLQSGIPTALPETNRERGLLTPEGQYLVQQINAAQKMSEGTYYYRKSDSESSSTTTFIKNSDTAEALLVRKGVKHTYAKKISKTILSSWYAGKIDKRQTSGINQMEVDPETYLPINKLGH